MTGIDLILIIPSVQPVISASQMREIDRLTTANHQIPSIELMQAAADACFRAIGSHFADNLKDKRGLILCGQGNNGGDGAALAQLLFNADVVVDVVLFGNLEGTHGDARINFEKVKHLSEAASSSPSSSLNPASISFSEFEEPSSWQQFNYRERTYDVVVDALFGTGLSRPLEGVFSEVVDDLKPPAPDSNSLPERPLIVSIDIPSGLNADSAKPIGPAIQADLTVTFTAPKLANVLPPASDLNGKLIVADIGSPRSLIEATNPNLFVNEAGDARDWLVRTRYTPNSFKNTHGHVLVVAGSPGFTGAAVLCGNAAMRSGAGLVTIATPASAQAAVAGQVMAEVMTTALAETDRGAVSDEATEHLRRLASKATVIAVGPGLTSEDERTRRFVYSVVKNRTTPIVIDADGLNCLVLDSGGWPQDLQGSAKAPLILTPHAGEMLRLLGTADKSVLNDRVAVARDFAVRNQLLLVLKGSRTLLAGPDGRVIINPTGNAGLGTAGSGDTLTGLISGFIAQDAATLGEASDALSATLAALFVGGLAGDLAARKLGMRTMLASDIREHFGEAIRTLDPEGEEVDTTTR